MMANLDCFLQLPHHMWLVLEEEAHGLDDSIHIVLSGCDHVVHMKEFGDGKVE